MFGIQNIGNTCYIGSILLCLFNNLPLKNYLSIVSQNNKFTNNFLNSFIESFSRYTQNTLDPIEFYLLLKQTFPQYNNINQHDANEFCLFLLDYLNTHIPPCFDTHRVDIQSPESSAVWGSNKNIISETFQGQISSIVKCTNCDYENITYENFMQLDIPLDCNLERTFIDLFSEQKIEDFNCESCTESNCFMKKQIEIFPITFTFVIKRYNKPNNIDFPKVLKINNLSYTLYAICNHTGSTMNSGHYTTFIKKNDNVFLINDESVTKVDDFDFKYAYILMYKCQ